MRRVAVVAVTADIMPSTVDRCLSAGIDEVLRKPMSLADHERVLARWVGDKAAA
jgi:CheY-like chemotaxis protein